MYLFISISRDTRVRVWVAAGVCIAKPFNQDRQPITLDQPPVYGVLGGPVGEGRSPNVVERTFPRSILLYA